MDGPYIALHYMRHNNITVVHAWLTISQASLQKAKLKTFMQAL